MTAVFANGPLKGTVIPNAELMPGAASGLPPLSIYLASAAVKTPGTTPLTLHRYVRNRSDARTNMAQYIYGGDLPTEALP